jgi:tetratricopeptide (TPR) repeat protein
MMDTNNTPNIPVRSFHLLLLLLLLLLTFITTSTAYGETKEQTAFERGLTLFKQGELKTAEQTFSALLAKNPDNAKANFFNGLTLQKLGQFKDSIPYFDQAMMQAPDYAQGASYFIGLAYSKIGQHSLSQKNLKQSVAIDPSSDIGQTAQSLLDRFEEGRQGGKRWWLQTAIGYEYNDNLTIEQTDTVSEEDDHAAFIEIGGGFRLLEQPVEAEITYDFYQSLYSEYSEYNMQSHRLGTSAARSFNNWDVSLGYDYIYLLIDNDEFMQTQSLMPAVGVSFGDLYANTGFNFQIKDFLDDENDRRDAQNYSGGVDLYYLGLKKIDNINIGLRYEYEEAEED